MLFQFVVTDAAADPAFDFVDDDLAKELVSQVCAGCLGCADTLENPGAYMVEKPVAGSEPNEGVYGLQFRLVGVSRQDRTDNQLLTAVDKMQELVTRGLARSLAERDEGAQKFQVFSALFVSNDSVEAPASFKNIFEAGPTWVSAADAEGDLEKEAAR